MDDEEQQADLARLTQELEDEHDREAARKTAEIMEKLDLQNFNAGINKTVSPTSLEAAHHVTYKMKDRYAIGVAKPDYNITLNNTIDGKQVQIGRLDFNGAMLKFEGNADASAMVFMDSLAVNFQGRLKAEHVSAAKLLTEFVTFELDSEMELDDGYRKGFNDAIHAVRGILSKKIKEMENKP
jgi:hypothetical protein